MTFSENTKHEILKLHALTEHLSQGLAQLLSLNALVMNDYERLRHAEAVKSLTTCLSMVTKNSASMAQDSSKETHRDGPTFL